ncbi:E3 SUMO-protein ligase ZBED1-like [Siphateles boraxobius]|uniref:E3 SUMO-protein ligase ZBED1-like n=1 Tax=Siphateles boraxobius TaxID=180520 RepID=UPI004063573C
METWKCMDIKQGLHHKNTDTDRYNDEGGKTINRNDTVCKLCLAHVAYSKGNTSNMSKYIQRKHPDITLPEHRSVERPEQTYRASSEKHSKITGALGVFIAKDLQPFSVVEDVGFKHLMKTLDPRYAVPSRTYFSAVVIPGLYDKTRKAIESDLTKTESLALTTDSWTSRATQSYMTVTVHYMLDWQMKSAVLQTRPLYESHTNNAANIVNAVNETVEPGPQTGCFAHTVNLAAKRAVSINGVSRLLGKVRKVVTFFHLSTTANQALAVKQEMLNLPKHKLINDVITRWNTSHDMLSRYVEQQPAIYSALTMDKNLMSHVTGIAMLTDGEQKMAEQLIEVLKPLKTVTTLMSSETTPTISMILPLKEMILKSMVPGDEDSTVIKEAKEAIAQDLDRRRYTDPDLQEYLQKATALDPKFKSQPSLDESSLDRLYKDLTTEILEYEPQRQAETMPPTEGQKSASPPPKKTAMAELFGEVFKKQDQVKALSQIVEDEVASYRLADSIGVDADPFMWWKTNECKFPHVAKAAKRLLCVPGTSVPSERIFSTAGDIVSANRSRLAPDSVDRLIFLHKNLSIVDE